MTPDFPLASSPAAGDPRALGIHDPADYGLVIDARSPREYAEDHIPGALNLPVVDNDEYAEVGTLHRDDPHAAYLVGVEHALLNMARDLKTIAGRIPKGARVLVYCFRGGKRSKLWGDTLRTVGYRVDVLPGGWKAYRRWVMDSLAALPAQLDWRVLAGSTGCGKTRLLAALQAQGAQVLDLEGIASHRGSLIGNLPDAPQPTQKWFDSQLLARMRALDPNRPIWIESESKRIGRIQIPDSLHEAIHATVPIHVQAPMSERVRLWREDYAHFVLDPERMVADLLPIRPLVGGEAYARWQSLAQARQIETLFEDVMRVHYDPCYERSLGRGFQRAIDAAGAGPEPIALLDLGPQALAQTAQDLRRRFEPAVEPA